MRLNRYSDKKIKFKTSSKKFLGRLEKNFSWKMHQIFASKENILRSSEYDFLKIEKSLSPAMESSVCVVWCSKLYQKFSLTLINIFYMYNELRKCIESNLQAKNEASSRFEKSFFQQPTLHFDCFGVWFS